MEEKPVEVYAIDLYHLLIGELRYAYSRNNHLQPSAAYGEAKKFLPLMLESNVNVTLNTAKQLCQECISDQLSANFYDGLDDEFGNRKEAIEFIEWLLTFVHENGNESYVPHDIDLYRDNIERSSNLKYTLSKLSDYDYEKGDYEKADKEFIATGTKSEVDKHLFSKILNTEQATFNAPKIKKGTKVIGEVLRIHEPVEHKGEIYLIKLEDK